MSISNWYSNLTQPKSTYLYCSQNSEVCKHLSLFFFFVIFSGVLFEGEYPKLQVPAYTRWSPLCSRLARPVFLEDFSFSAFFSWPKVLVINLFQFSAIDYVQEVRFSISIRIPLVFLALIPRLTFFDTLMQHQFPGLHNFIRQL